MPDPVGVDRHLDLVPGDEPLLEHRRQLPCRDERAVGDRQDVVAAVRPQPGAALVVDGEPHPVPPAQQAAGQLLDRDARDGPSTPARRCSCSRSTAVFSSRWVGASACCQSQPPHPPARAHGHGAADPAGSGLEHRDRVGPAERTAAVVGDDRVHPLARQRVPDEHDALAPVVAPHARDAVAAVRDGADVQVEHAVRPVEDLEFPAPSSRPPRTAAVTSGLRRPWPACS